MNTIDSTKYRQVLQDDTGAPGTVYIGVTNYPNATTADTEWAIQRITVAGALTTTAWAGGTNEVAPQKWAWDNRGSLTYG